MALNKISINDTTTVNTGVVYDISKATSQSYDSLSAALGTNGNNVPLEIREGGMIVRFVQTNDNKYVQYRLMANTFSTDEDNWQGVDDVPTAGSDNLVKSGGTANKISELEKKTNKTESDLIDLVNSKHPQTQETGWYVTDTNGNVGMKYTEEGLDFAKLSQHAVEVLKDSNIGGTSNVANVSERGFFVVDENLNIGMYVDNDGVHAKNILEYEIVKS